MAKPAPGQRVVAAVIIAALGLASMALAGNRIDFDGPTTVHVTNRAVAKRMNAMARADAAIQALGDMMGGRRLYNEHQAREVRKILIGTMEDIPSLFRRPQTDPLSRARPLIWTHKGDFRDRARAAERAARQLDVDRYEDIRRTLPRLVEACLDCHRIYRDP